MKIEQNCFKDCIKLTEITIPSSVKKIGPYSFNGCKALKIINIPSSVKEICDYAFSNCSSIEHITIPSSVTKIGKCIISNCSNLEQITIPLSLASYNVNEYKSIINNENEYKYEDISIYYGNSTLFKMTNKKTGEIFVLKIIQSCMVYNEKEFLHRVYLFNNLPGLLPVNKYLLPLFKNEKNNLNLSEIEVTDETGKSILKTFHCYAVISKYMKNGDISHITHEYLESKGTKNNDIMNPTIRSKIVFGVASIMSRFHGNNLVFFNLNLSNVLLDDNLEPIIGFHLGYYQYKKLNLIRFIPISPELLEDSFYHLYNYFPVDVHSFGYFLFYMFQTDSDDFDSLNMYFHRYRSIKKPDEIPNHYWKIIIECVDYSSYLRPSFNYIIKHLSDDSFAFEEYGMKTDLKQLHEYQNRMKYKETMNFYYFELKYSRDCYSSLKI